MKLLDLTNKDLILLDVDASSKSQLFEIGANEFLKANVIENKDEFVKALQQREKEGPTGLDCGIAIPHGKGYVVKKPAFLVAKLRQPLSMYESIQNDNSVDLVFMLALPQINKQNIHIELLSKLSTALMDKEFVKAIRNAKKVDDVLCVIDSIKDANNIKVEKGKHKLLAVTACGAGVAHTYMAAESLERAAAEMAVSICVEKQGANGIEHSPTTQEIQEAEGIIIATDAEPQQMERYEGLPFIKVRVAEPMKDAKGLISRVLEKPDGRLKSVSTNTTQTPQTPSGFIKTLMPSVMTGISYMIPVVVGAGLVLAVAKIIALFLGVPNGEIELIEYATSNNDALTFLHDLSNFGGFIFSLMYPVLSGFIAYAIAGRLGLAAGFIGGGLAGGLQYSVQNTQGHLTSGFIGAILVGWLVGFTARFLNDKINLHKNIISLKPMLIIPLTTILLAYVTNLFIFEPIGGGLNKALIDLIAESNGTYAVTVVIAAATAFDMGGPFNKAALAVTLSLAADRSFPVTPNIMGAIIPPLGCGVSVILNQYIFKKDIYDEQMVENGYTSIISGLVGITEGAIPFALTNPVITISLNIVGSVLAACIAMFFNATIWYTIPQFWGWPLITNLIPYLFALTFGILFVALGNIYFRNFVVMKKKKVTS